MDVQNSKTTVVFADICQSRKIFLDLGDIEGQKLVKQILDILVNKSMTHDGELIKTIGDEILCVFPHPDAATAAALEMHQALSQNIFSPALNNHPAIHVGLHAGPVIRKNGDIFGDTVNVAARLVSMAKAHQILTTEHTASILNQNHQSRLRHVDTVVLAGQNQMISIYEIIWEEQEMTVVVERPEGLSCQTGPSLQLMHHNITLNFDHTCQIVTIGRHESCDIHIDHKSVSRFHANIEKRKEKFVLVDQSTNGTHINFDNEEKQFIHRDEIFLQNSGYLGLGHDAEITSPDAVFFKVLI